MIGRVKERLDSVVNDVPQREYFHQFYNRENESVPQGVTGLYLWPGGHLSIHTWPEKKMAAIDVVGHGDEDDLVQRVRTVLPGEYEIISEQGSRDSSRTVGRQVTADFMLGEGRRQGGASDIAYLRDADRALALLQNISSDSCFHVVGKVAYGSAEGVDAAVILSESHFSLHYDRQHRQARVDIFTCGEEGDPQTGLELLKTRLQAEPHHEKSYRR